MYQNRNGIQFSYNDTFSLDAKLAPIMLNAINKFLEVKSSKDAWFGVPNSIMNELFEPSDGHTNEQLDIGDKEWTRRLNEMKYAFEQSIIDEIDLMPDDAQKRLLPDNIDHYDSLFIQLIPNPNYSEEINNKYWEDMKARRERIQQGLDYFAKHFSDLWW
jgi:hypothetical protein